MATVADIARDLLGSMASDVSMPVAVRWIDNRYKEIVSKVQFKHLRKRGVITIPAAVSAGTVAVVQESTSVVGTDTTWATSPGVFTTGASPYWAMRASSIWYGVDAVSADGAMELTDEYAETDNATASYNIVKRYHALATNARWLGMFVVPAIGLPIGHPVSMDEMDAEAPMRELVGSTYPSKVSQVQMSPAGALMIEAYPYPKDITVLHYVYWDLPSALAIDSTVPAQIDGYVLKEGAYIDFCRYMMATREKEGKINSAAFWRNEYNSSETRWKKYMADAARTDRAVDDVCWLMERAGRQGYLPAQWYRRDLTIESS